MKKISSLIMLACVAWAASAIAAQRQFKILEVDQNRKGPYAVFSGGAIHGITMGSEVCVLPAGAKGKSKKPVFCAPVVSIRKRAAAFYIPAGYQTEVFMGAVVTIQIADETPTKPTEAVEDLAPLDDGDDGEQGEVVAEPAPEPTPPAPTPATPKSREWFPAGQYFDAAYHLQVTPAIKATSLSFAALPRDNTNQPWRARDTLGLAPLGLQLAWAHAFLSDNSHLGLRGFYARSTTGSFDNDYDLSDSQSHVETTAQATNLGLSLFYGFVNQMNDRFAFRTSAGLGYRRTTVAVKSALDGPASVTLVDGNVISSAPVIELAGGSTWRIGGMEWLAQLAVAIPANLKTTTSGTFNSVQDVPEGDVKSNVIESTGPAKGFEISLALGMTKKI